MYKKLYAIYKLIYRVSKKETMKEYIYKIMTEFNIGDSTINNKFEVSGNYLLINDTPTYELSETTIDGGNNQIRSAIKINNTFKNYIIRFSEKTDCSIIEHMAQIILYGMCQYTKEELGYNPICKVYLLAEDSKSIISVLDKQYIILESYIKSNLNNLPKLAFLFIKINKLLTKLQEVHNFYHNDFKFNNIFISKDSSDFVDKIYLIDFGFSSFTMNYNTTSDKFDFDADMCYYEPIRNVLKSANKKTHDFLFLLLSTNFFLNTPPEFDDLVEQIIEPDSYAFFHLKIINRSRTVQTGKYNTELNSSTPWHILYNDVPELRLKDDYQNILLELIPKSLKYYEMAK